MLVCMCRFPFPAVVGVHTPHEFVPPGYKVNSAASHIRNESPRSGLVLLLRAYKFRYHLGARTVGSFAAFSQ
jgi:hypothetical protein